jgi:hypothetical protein
VHLHAGEAPLVHAHLPEVAPVEDESVVHMEAFHSHADARSLDLLTTTVVPLVQITVAVISTIAVLGSNDIAHGYATLGSPVAHGPPDSELQIPRAPPA